MSTKPKQVAKKPITKPKQVAKKPITKPKQVAKKPITKPKQVGRGNYNFYQDGTTPQKPVVTPQKPVVTPQKPVVTPQKTISLKPLPPLIKNDSSITPQKLKTLSPLVADLQTTQPKAKKRILQIPPYLLNKYAELQTTKTKALPPIAESKPLRGVCSRILTPKQVGPICWFMATFVAMFYSQRSRKILLEASKTWKTKNEIYSLLNHVLNDKYSKTMTSTDYNKASEETFNEILKYLNKHDPLSFPYDPTIHEEGFYSEYYIGKLYKLLNVDYKVFDYNKRDNHLFYSYLNMGFDSVEYETIKNDIESYLYPNRSFIYKDEDMNAPKILMVIVHDDEDSTIQSKQYEDLFPGTIISKGNTKQQITSMNDKIFYRGREYHLDSVILGNWNVTQLGGGHAIAGITCKGNKYVYNGWVRTSKDPAMANAEIRQDIPCELMRYDWDIKQEANFCLSRKNCKLVKQTGFEAIKSDLCYNFEKGYRMLVYVRTEGITVTSKSLSNKSQDIVDLDL
jgi:hypothetical protein